MPTVSVIIPNYNHAKYLRKRVESVLAQTYQDFELILLDDCSTDGSQEILGSYARDPRVRMEFNAENSGTPFKQWNKGVCRARGKYVWIAESDDYAEPRLLEALVAKLESDPKITLTYCRSWRAEENDQVNGFAEWHMDTLKLACAEKDFVADGLWFSSQVFTLTNPIPNASAVVFRREAYEKVGGADEEFRLCGDYKVWALVALEGKVAYVAEPLNYFRWHTQNARSSSRTGVLDLAEYFYVMEWVLGWLAPPETLAKRATAGRSVRELPSYLTPAERVRDTLSRIRAIADWNLSHNSYVKREAMQAYFLDWEFALIGKEFEIAPPNRWRFFLHRVNFYRRYSPGMNWKQKLVNLLRVAGAPLVGYRSRHWPQEAYSWMANATNRLLGMDQTPGSS